VRHVGLVDRGSLVGEGVVTGEPAAWWWEICVDEQAARSARREATESELRECAASSATGSGTLNGER
jgi:hypothetical protein